MVVKDTKDKQEFPISLSQAEQKLIALGSRFNENAVKINYDLLAKHGGYTKGSAQVLYRKAVRKLADAYPVDVEEGEAANNLDGDVETPSSEPTSTPSKKTPKTPRSRNSASKKRKGPLASEDIEGSPMFTTLTPSTAACHISKGHGHDDSETEPTTPTKRPKKSPFRKTASPITTMTDDVFGASDSHLIKQEDAAYPSLKSEQDK